LRKIDRRASEEELTIKDKYIKRRDSIRKGNGTDEEKSDALKKADAEEKYELEQVQLDQAVKRADEAIYTAMASQQSAED